MGKKYGPSDPEQRRLMFLAWANDRAHDQRVRILRVPGRPGVYRTRSKSDPNSWYTLVTDETGYVACSCLGFFHRQWCKHEQQLRNRLGREAQKSTGDGLDADLVMPH